MPKVTLSNADGSTQDFFPQSYTDAAVQQAINSAPAPVNTVSPDVSDVVLTDDSKKKFIAAA